MLKSYPVFHKKIHRNIIESKQIKLLENANDKYYNAFLLKVSVLLPYFCKDVYFNLSSSVKWSVLAHLKSRRLGQNFQAQKPVERSSPHYYRTNKNTKNTFKIN